MKQAAFKKSIQELFKQQERLLSRRNRKSPGGNGIYERYEFPVLTAAHAPITWRYDLDQKTNPFLMERIGVNAAFNAGLFCTRASIWCGTGRGGRPQIVLRRGREPEWDRSLSLLGLSDSDA